MIKGHSYDKQLYYSVVDRLINNTFLNGCNGIFKQEGNACNITYTNNTITISDGFFIVQGGLTEINGTENINVLLDGSYCVLVYELDMQKQNSDTNFAQGQFKILSGQNSYPTLTTQKLNENNGVYQFEFARFIASNNGITNFVDTRTFLDYNSIFSYIKQHIEQIEQGSIYITRSEYEEFSSSIVQQPLILIQEDEPSPIEGKTIIWFKPKE